jgi:deoxyadenosine/deoxycytidine kinase
LDGRSVLLDVIYTDIEMHASLLLNGKDLDVVRETLRMDIASLGYPDYIVCLRNSEENTKKYIKLGGRDFDAGDEYFTKYVLPLQKKFEEMAGNVPASVKVLQLDRSGLDFDKEEDIKVILNFINS